VFLQDEATVAYFEIPFTAIRGFTLQRNGQGRKRTLAFRDQLAYHGAG
jgi:hypothetical protein